MIEQRRSANPNVILAFLLLTYIFNFLDRQILGILAGPIMEDLKLNDAEFGSRMSGQGIFAEQIRQLFHVACRKAGIDGRHPQLSTAAFRLPPGPQLTLFE